MLIYQKVTVGNKNVCIYIYICIIMKILLKIITIIVIINYINILSSIIITIIMCYIYIYIYTIIYIIVSPTFKHNHMFDHVCIFTLPLLVNIDWVVSATFMW